MSDLEAMQQEFAGNGDLLLAVICGVESSYGETVERLSEAMGHIQFQDVMRQRMGHVQEALTEMGEHLLELNENRKHPIGTATWSGRFNRFWTRIWTVQDGQPDHDAPTRCRWRSGQRNTVGRRLSCSRAIIRSRSCKKSFGSTRI